MARKWWGRNTRCCLDRQPDSGWQTLLPNLGGLAGKNKDKTPLVVFPEDFHLSLIISHNALGLHPQLRNARLFRVITFINNDQKSPGMFNEILWRDNYHGIES